ncbi:MAG: hypothetical protein AAGK37_11015 [Pseudomonadota bacterium]
MSDFENLTLADIEVILPPSEPDLAPDDLDEAIGKRLSHFDAELVRMADLSQILDALGGRFDLIPVPPQREELQPLVERARRELRRGRMQSDRVRLDRNIALLTAIRAEVSQ